MRINDRRVCARLGELAHGDETPSQLVLRIVDERDQALAKVRQLERQLRYQCAQVRRYREEERLLKAQPCEHLTPDQARSIALAREEWLNGR